MCCWAPLATAPIDSLNIRVSRDNLAITATVTTPLACANGATGVITATATGGVLPYQYSLNGGGFQSANTFTALGAGTYTVRGA